MIIVPGARGGPGGPGNNTVGAMRSHIWMAIGLVAGLALGLTAALTQSPALLAFARWLRPFGTLFLNLLSMVVIPLVATALFQGVAGLGDVRRMGSLGARTPGFFAATTIPANAIGPFGLVAGAVVQYGSSLVTTMVLFVLAVIVGLALFMAVVYLPAVALLVRLNVGRYLRAIRGSMLMAFSTTSSVATLPVMLEAAETDLKVSRTVASFVLPVGASIGRAGSALFQAVAVLFVARLYGVALGLTDALQAGAAVFLTSLTVASVPSASIVSLVPAFAATGLPLAGLSLLLGFDRIPDMFRTTTNVVRHLTGAVVVAAVEGEMLE